MPKVIKNEKEKSTRLSFSFPMWMKEKLEKLAKEDDRPVSSYIRRVLINHIENSK